VVVGIEAHGFDPSTHAVVTLQLRQVRTMFVARARWTDRVDNRLAEAGRITSQYRHPLSRQGHLE
jgi:hypothetical protein